MLAGGGLRQDGGQLAQVVEVRASLGAGWGIGKEPGLARDHERPDAVLKTDIIDDRRPILPELFWTNLDSAGPGFSVHCQPIYPWRDRSEIQARSAPMERLVHNASS